MTSNQQWGVDQQPKIAYDHEDRTESAQPRLSEEDRETMRQVYKAAIEIPVSQFANLSELDFCVNYGNKPSTWRIGPFSIDKSLTFTKTLRMDDPTEIGWESTILGNPTLIERDEDLHMFYRAYPGKESQSTRIGHAVYTPQKGWDDLSGPPTLYSTEPDEINSVEDAKIYKVDDTYYMFYNSVWTPDAEFSARIRQGYRDWGIFVVTKLAVSKDLIHFEKKGQVVPYSVSKGWSKGAVLPRDPYGQAVKINGKYLMFLSEGCGDAQFIGYSDDLLTWEFKQQTYLKLSPDMGRVAEVACCSVNFEPSGKYFVLDIFYMDANQKYQAAQALYLIDDPTRPLAIEKGGSLAWGGLLKYRGEWIVAQGWDSPTDRQDMYLYKYSGFPHVEIDFE